LRTALSAIEVYNKPDFKEREQVFAILLVCAWEALLKAKLLKDNRNRLPVLYVHQGKRYKRKRGGIPITIGIEEAIKRCDLPPIVADNIRHLVDIRDAAIHLTAESEILAHLVFTLGAASLQNYARLVRQWFRVGLSDYNFYILPLGFSYPFKCIRIADLRKEPPDIAHIVADVSKAQEEGRSHKGDFFLLCEIKTDLVAATKLTGEADLVAAVREAGAEAIVVPRPINILDQYPYTYGQIWAEVRKQLPQVKQPAFNTFLQTHKLRGSPNYSAYNFRSRVDQAKGPRKGTAVLYNAGCLRYVLDGLRSQVEESKASA